MEEDILTINFKEFFKLLWKGKWWVVGITGLFIVLGVWYSSSLREEFTSQGKILPEVSGRTSSSQLSGLAALAGVNIGASASGSDAIRPELYPDVINSTPFFLELLNTEVITKNNQKVPFEEFYHQNIENGVDPTPEKLTKFPVSEKGLIVVNQLNEKRLKDLNERITASLELKNGVIIIRSKMPDPVVAASVTLFAMNYLVDYVTEYRTEKLRQDVNYLAEQVGASKGKYYSDQTRRASYADQYQLGTLRSQSADIQRERIESDYRLSSTIYNELLKQFEEAKLKLQQETPIFQVLEPPKVSNLKTEPKRSLIVLTFMVLGGIISVLFLTFFRKGYKQFVNI